MRIAAVSYDSPETLRDFAEKHSIGFPLLSDRDSAVIRRFGIFNENMAPGLRAYGVPHPVEYLVGPDGVVVRKYFVPNYQHRTNAAAVALKEFDAVSGDAPRIHLQSGAVSIQIGLASATAFAGQQIGFYARFSVAEGWHVYGSPVSSDYSPLLVNFDDHKVIQQTFELPPPAMQTSALGETLPVYSGDLKGKGTVLLRFPLPEGETTLSGRVTLQQCSDTVCEPPESLPFEVPLKLAKFMVAH